MLQEYLKIRKALGQSTHKRGGGAVTASTVVAGGRRQLDCLRLDAGSSSGKHSAAQPTFTSSHPAALAPVAPGDRRVNVRSSHDQKDKRRKQTQKTAVLINERRAPTNPFSKARKTASIMTGNQSSSIVAAGSASRTPKGSQRQIANNPFAKSSLKQPTKSFKISDTRRDRQHQPLHVSASTATSSATSRKRNPFAKGSASSASSASAAAPLSSSAKARGKSPAVGVVVNSSARSGLKLCSKSALPSPDRKDTGTVVTGDSAEQIDAPPANAGPAVGTFVSTTSTGHTLQSSQELAADAILDQIMSEFDVPADKAPPLKPRPPQQDHRLDAGGGSGSADAGAAASGHTLHACGTGKQRPKQKQNRRTFGSFSRFLVLDIVRNHYTPLEPAGARAREELILRLFDERQQAVRQCHLRQDWSRTRVDAGDFVHVTGVFSADSNTCIVDNLQHLIVVHPDRLLTGTRVADSFDCSRKAVLSERFNTLSGSSFAMIQGTMLHEVFEGCVRQEDSKKGTGFVQKFIAETVSEVVQNHLAEVLASSETEVTATAKIGEFVPLLQQWAANFLRQDPAEEVRFELPNRPSKAEAGASHKLCVSKVMDIEENIWCPQFGIKGKVDASVEVTIHTVNAARPGSRAAGPRIINTKKAVVPLELKTGKVSARGLTSHRAQVILYMLMMDGRYGTAVEEGLLLYIKSGQSFGLPLDHNDTRALIIARNELAHFITERMKLPEMLRNPGACRRCWHLTNCSLTHAALENGDRESSGLGELYSEITGHLNETHLDYFRNWCEMITLEYSPNAAQKNIWAMTSLEREQAAGTCFSTMVISDDGPASGTQSPSKSSAVPNAGASRYEHFYRFTRHVSHPGASNPDSSPLHELRVGVDDRVVVSDDDGSRVAFTFGKVSKVTKSHVDVHTDTEIVSVLPTTTPLTSPAASPCSLPFKQRIFRLDKDMTSYGMKIALSNVAKLFVPASAPEGTSLPERDLERWARHRRSIVDLASPVFEAPPDDHAKKMQTLVAKSNMNGGQKRAMASALAAKDYCLILGMPGTGKTTTITRLVDLLVQCGKSVLIASYTHSAVDNILLKLQEEDIEFLRVGPINRIHPDIRARHANTLLESIKTTSGLREAYSSYNVVASTCLGVKHPVFEYRRFDYCIIDEASQITQPVCLGPIGMADSFILVGDHYQLPPLVQSDEARSKGMGISLFRRLSEAHPRAIVELEDQYRMNSSVMRIANAMIYRDRLKCGTAAVASSNLNLAKFELWQSGQDGAAPRPAPWLVRAVDPTQPVAFLDTARVPGTETRVGHLVRNDVEAKLVVRLVEHLSAAGLSADAIGIISPYRMQLKAIRQQMGGRFERVEVNTIDKYQGRDKECIILSLVRSNSSGAIGSLLKDWRRVNVSVTRAKHKLLIVGDGATLVAAHLFRRMLAVVDAEDWRQVLPPGAHL